MQACLVLLEDAFAARKRDEKGYWTRASTARNIFVEPHMCCKKIWLGQIASIFSDVFLLTFALRHQAPCSHPVFF